MHLDVKVVYAAALPLGFQGLHVELELPLPHIFAHEPRPDGYDGLYGVARLPG